MNIPVFSTDKLAAALIPKLPLNRDTGKDEILNKHNYADSSVCFISSLSFVSHGF